MIDRNHRGDRVRPADGQPLHQAHAPYNFVPLPDRVLEAPSPPDASMYHEVRHTGHIDLRVEALTPLYVRGTASLDQLATETKNLSAFYAPTGTPAIPGSSIRGMLRTLIEIAGATRAMFAAASLPTDYGGSHLAATAAGDRDL